MRCGPEASTLDRQVSLSHTAPPSAAAPDETASRRAQRPSCLRRLSPVTSINLSAARQSWRDKYRICSQTWWGPLPLLFSLPLSSPPLFSALSSHITSYSKIWPPTNVAHFNTGNHGWMLIMTGAEIHVEIYANQLKKKTQKLKNMTSSEHSDSGTKLTPDQLLNPSHAQSAQIFYGTVTKMSHTHIASV